METAIANASASSEMARLIAAHFPLSPVPSVPEIRLHKAGPGSGVWRLAEADQNFGTPYWAYHWGGGLALARHVLDHPATVAGRRVLDLGAGSGIVAIAAAKAGARQVIAADVDPCAIAAMKLNAAANDVSISPLLCDFTASPPPAADVVLAGDLFYEADLAIRLTAFLDRCLAAGMDILIGDPWRAHLPRTRLKLLAQYEGGDFGDGDALRLNGVFAFRGAIAGAVPCGAQGTAPW